MPSSPEEGEGQGMGPGRGPRTTPAASASPPPLSSTSPDPSPSGYYRRFGTSAGGGGGAGKCSPCARYLRSALLGVPDGGDGYDAATASLPGGRGSVSGGGGPKSLLEAMGATVSLPSEAAAAGSAGTADEGEEEGASVVVTIPGRRRHGSSESPLSPEAARSSVRADVLRRRASTAAGALADRIRGVAASPTSPVATSAVPDRDRAGAASNLDRHPPLSVSVSCRPCSSTGPESGARAYVRGPRPLSVVLCSNRLRTPNDVSEVLVHELIHVYDVHVRGLDLRDCRQLAYSEVRAAREAECANGGAGAVGAGSGSGTVMSGAGAGAGAGGVGGGAGGGGFLSEFARRMCIRSRAGAATCNMFPERGRSCVAEVMERAVRDRAPFGEDGKDDRAPFGPTGGAGAGAGRRNGNGAGGGGGGGADNGNGGAGGGGGETIFGRPFASTYPSASGGAGRPSQR